MHHRDETGDGQRIHHGPPAEFLDDPVRARPRQQSAVGAVQHPTPCTTRGPAILSSGMPKLAQNTSKASPMRLRFGQVENAADDRIGRRRDVDRYGRDRIEVGGQVEQGRGNDERPRTRKALRLAACGPPPCTGGSGCRLRAAGINSPQCMQAMVEAVGAVSPSGAISRHTWALSRHARTNNESTAAARKHSAPASMVHVDRDAQSRVGHRQAQQKPRRAWPRSAARWRCENRSRARRAVCRYGSRASTAASVPKRSTGNTMTEQQDEHRQKSPALGPQKRDAHRQRAGQGRAEGRGGEEGVRTSREPAAAGSRWSRRASHPNS